MIYVNTRRNKKPTKSNGYLVYETERCTTPITRLRKSERGGYYQGLVVLPEDNAPYGSDFGDGVWCGVNKSMNPTLNLPVLSRGEEVRV